MSDLKTDYKDDVLDVSANVKRIFNLVDQDGKIVVANVSIQDITKYAQEGDSFGAADINATNEAVNGKLDGSSTVDPMLATEEGFAADAYQTKLQLEECFQSVSDGKALVASAITDKGVNTASGAAFETIANNINSIKDVANNTPGTAVASVLTKGYTAWVNGVKITGTRPTVVKSLSGTIPYANTNYTGDANGWYRAGRTYSIPITFSNAFDTTPSIALTRSRQDTDVSCSIKPINISRTGFTIQLSVGEDDKFEIQWKAEA